MLNTNFLISATAATSTTASAPFHPAEKNSVNLYPPLIPFIRLLNIPGKFWKIHWFSYISKFLSVATGYVPACTTNLQIFTVFCCIHRQIHHMSRTPFLILNFLDFDVYVLVTPTFPENQRKCANFVKNVAILFLWSKRAIVVPNNLIDSTTNVTFHPYNHEVKRIIRHNFKLLQNDPETGRTFWQPPLISFASKT